MQLAFFSCSANGIEARVHAVIAGLVPHAPGLEDHLPPAVPARNRAAPHRHQRIALLDEFVVEVLGPGECACQFLRADLGRIDVQRVVRKRPGKAQTQHALEAVGRRAGARVGRKGREIDELREAPVHQRGKVEFGARCRASAHQQRRAQSAKRRERALTAAPRERAR